MKDKRTFRVSLFNVGIDVPVAIYTGCQHAYEQEGTVYIVRQDGTETKTNMKFIAEVE